MPPFYRFIEIAVYSLLNFLPFLILAMYPFKKTLRFSYTLTNFFIGLLTILQILFGICAGLLFPAYTPLISLLSTSTYLVFYCIAVKAHPGKMAFMLLMISNIANLVVISSKFLEGCLFPDMARQPYRYSYSVCMILIELVFCTALFFYVNKFCTDVLNYQVSRHVWAYLWFVPATFYMIWYYHLYSSQLSSIEVALRLDHLLWLISINAGALLVYTIIFRLISEMRKNQVLSDTNQALERQKVQYNALDKRIRESRQARHDLRHHVHLLSAYAKDGKYQELKDYLDNYQTSLSDETPVYFCDHYALNALLTYYAQIAKQNHTRFQAAIQVPKELNIPDSALIVLVSNLLENALEACMVSESPDPFIRIKGKPEQNCLFFLIENSSKKAPVQDRNGAYLSTKHKGTGLGISSAQEIVQRYGGKFQITYEQNVFCVSVLLPGI